MHGLVFSASVKIEAGALDDKITYGHMHGYSGIIDREKVSFEPEEDKLDHVPFEQRIMMLRISQNNETKNAFHEEPLVLGDAVLRGGQPSDTIRLRKRKKTATYVL